MFRFVQLELPGALGPATGRYVLRERAGEDPGRVLVIAAPGPARPRIRRRRRRRARRIASGPGPALVPLTRATVIEAAPLASRHEADAWLERAAGADADAT